MGQYSSRACQIYRTLKGVMISEESDWAVLEVRIGQDHSPYNYKASVVHHVVCLLGVVIEQDQYQIDLSVSSGFICIRTMPIYLWHISVSTV